VHSVWLKAQEKLHQNDPEGAYKIVMANGDDIYLLRLLAQTGPISKALQRETVKEVLIKLNKIVRSGILEAFAIEWIDRFY